MIKFLDKKAVMAFHHDLVKTYGGTHGIRDEGLLESALAQPQVSFGGEYMHEDIFEMASAYGFHICKNHPFFDGNKRTALVAMYTFLYVNGYRLQADKKALYAVMVDIASGKMGKAALANFLEENVKEKD
jgi:death-on-curing protein